MVVSDQGRMRLWCDKGSEMLWRVSSFGFGGCGTFTSCAPQRRCNPWLGWWWWLERRSPALSCTSPACFWRCSFPSSPECRPGTQRETASMHNNLPPVSHQKLLWFFFLWGGNSEQTNKQSTSEESLSSADTGEQFCANQKEDFVRQLSNVISQDILTHSLPLNHHSFFALYSRSPLPFFLKNPSHARIINTPPSGSGLFPELGSKVQLPARGFWEGSPCTTWK